MTVRRALAFAAALAAVSASAEPVAPPARRDYDWCSGVVVRPDQMMQSPGSCEPVWSNEEIARGAEVVMLGDARDVSEPAIPPRVDRCGRNETHTAYAKRVAELLRLRQSSGLPPLEIVHMTRFDLVTPPLAALPGFDARFLVETQRPWREVVDFFEHDGSEPCRQGGCRWSDAESGNGNDAADIHTRLRDLIDASGGEGAYQHKVYYLIRGTTGQQLFFPIAAVADLRNPKYRAWRVAEAKRAMEVGHYSAIHLNQKFWQYGARYWIGGDSGDVANMNRTGNGGWTAAPNGYGYPEYVAGWLALARDLRAAGVPYAVDLQGPELFIRGDDPSTPANEGEMIREGARNARLVLLDRYGFTTEETLRSATADLEAHGARVVRIQSSCGFGKP